MLPIDTILNIIRTEIKSGCTFISNLGAAVFLMFIAIELIKGGIDASSGRGFTIDKTLYLYVFLALLFVNYPEIQYHLKEYSIDFCKHIYKNFGGYNMSIKPSLDIFSQLWKGLKANPIKFLLKWPITVLFSVLTAVVSAIIAVIAMIAVDIVILAAFLGFEIVIAVAPFFIPFFMSSDYSHIARQWVNQILMYLMQLPLIALVLKLVDRLNKEVAHDFFYKEFLGKNNITSMYAVIFIPLLGLGLIWQALQVSKMLFPPSGGIIGTGIGAPVAAATAYALRVAEKVAGKAAKAGMS